MFHLRWLFRAIFYFVFLLDKSYTLYYIILYYFILYYITLYYITLYGISHVQVGKLDMVVPRTTGCPNSGLAPDF